MGTDFTFDQKATIIACPMCGHRHWGPNSSPVNCIQCGANLLAATPDIGTKLFSPMQIAAAAFLGGWLAGFLVLALNYLHLKRAGAAIASTAVGSLLLIGWMKLAVSVPVLAKIPGMVLWMFVMLAMLLIANVTQGTEYKRHIATGGKPINGWHAAGYMLPAVILSFGAGVILLLILV